MDIILSWRYELQPIFLNGTNYLPNILNYYSDFEMFYAYKSTICFIVS